MNDQPHFQKPELVAPELQGPDEVFTTLDPHPSTAAAAAGEPKRLELTEKEPPVTDESTVEEENPGTEAIAPKAAGGIISSMVTIEHKPEPRVAAEPATVEAIAETLSQDATPPDKPSLDTGEDEDGTPPRPDEPAVPGGAAPPGNGTPPRPPEQGGGDEDSSSEDNGSEDGTPPDDGAEDAREAPKRATEVLNEISTRVTIEALPEAKRMIANEETSNRDVYAAALVVGQCAIRNNIAGKQQEAHELIGALREAPHSKDSQTVSILFQISRRHSVEADQLLREKLAVNMSKVQTEIDQAKINDPDNQYPMPENDRLNTIINICEQNGIPPNAWINDFSPNPEYRWLQYARHYIRIYQPEAHDANVVSGQENISRVVDELTKTDHLPDSFALAVTPELLRTLPTTKLREQVLMNFFVTAAMQPQTPNGLRTYFSVAEQVALQPELASTERLSALAKRLDSYTKEIRRKGVSDYGLKLAAGPWELARIHLNSSPHEVMRFMDSYIAQELQAQGAPTGSELDEVLNNTLIPGRDRSFLTLSRLHRTAGDFQGALAYLGGISGRENLEEEYKDLFAAVTEQSQLEMLRPDPLTMSSNTGLERHYNASLALLSDDIDTLNETAREIAKDYRAVDTTVDDYYLQQIIPRVAQTNTALALDITRFIVQKLTEKGVSLAHVLPFWAMLLKANQSDAIPGVLEAIDRATAGNPVRKAAQLMRLTMEIGNAPHISG